MATPESPPLYDKIYPKSPINRALDIIILFLLASLLVYRLLSWDKHGFPWLLAFLCESWFTFIWILNVSTKWSPADFRTYPERLSQRVEEEELPPVDMFVTTADPVLEPPMITVNTVISLLAVDYPVDKLACYVSDDACSAVTFYSLVEASKFARVWVPFCKKYNIQVRAPFRYFSTEYKSSTTNLTSAEFRQECDKMKDEYDQLTRKIAMAAHKSNLWDSNDNLVAFSNIERKNHPTIVKVVWENQQGITEELPHLIYISREKMPRYHHHYKAGAMNVLTRVSGLITNAPFMLNVDCDMFVNNPQIVHHAMCLLLGCKNERDSAYVQSPQIFYDGLKDDPFGNQLVVLFRYVGRGLVGIQGPVYGGTGCFHRRKVIYGLCPNDIGDQANYLTPVNENLSEEDLVRIFGNSRKLVKSAADTLQGKISSRPKDLSNLVEEAHQVAGCAYEYGSAWGTKVGWQYGSTTEDVLTGLMIQGRGWRSSFCAPKPPAFLGCAPSGGPAAMTQQKRWATGLFEVLISKSNPIFATLAGKLQVRQCLGYSWVLLWGARSIPELCYALLPAYCIITNTNFLPKVQEPAICIHFSLFLIYNVYTLLEYLQTGLSVRAWWNNSRMARITSTCAWLFGFIGVIVKILGISETVFEVTQKDTQSSIVDSDDGDAGRFTFDDSPIFVPGTTLFLVHISALAASLLGLQSPVGDSIGEVLCSWCVVFCFWPFGRGLFGKGKYGIPSPTICKSALLSLAFLYFCKKNSSQGLISY